MELIRTFHSVGQGAFYTEKHIFDTNEFVIVYDCGSKTLKGKKFETKMPLHFLKNK